jgi:mannose-6-phosphate isomerase-like protein (cupin superfamily)
MRNVVRLEDAMAWEAPEPNRRTMALMFERDVTPTRSMAAGYVRIPPGNEQVKLSVHPDGEEIYFVVTGRARFYLGDEAHEIDPGTAVYVAPGMPHRAVSIGDDDLVLYYVNAPSVFGPVGGYEAFVQGWTRIK